MLRKLPPVGNTIVVKEECIDDEALTRIFPGWDAFYYGSGAMALASALKAVLDSKNNSQREVLLPAYSCPELVSATLFAGGTPILVDLEKDRPWLSLDDLIRKVTFKTAAIVAVDLFGIPERFAEIRKVIGNQEIAIIEDSAQYMPKTPGPNSWAGDIVILSFGRGKPVSLLGGGALLTREGDSLLDFISKLGNSSPASSLRRFRVRLKCHLYNVLIKPAYYWIPSSLPFLSLGGTRFKELSSIDSMDTELICLLSPNLKKYSKVPKSYAVEIKSILNKCSTTEVFDLADATAVELENLIRYPILIRSPVRRAQFLENAKKIGLGVTTLYGTNLTGVAGIGKDISSQRGLSNSSAFAEELITLPVHSLVTRDDIENLKMLIKTVG